MSFKCTHFLLGSDSADFWGNYTYGVSVPAVPVLFLLALLSLENVLEFFIVNSKYGQNDSTFDDCLRWWPAHTMYKMGVPGVSTSFSCGLLLDSPSIFSVLYDGSWLIWLKDPFQNLLTRSLIYNCFSSVSVVCPVSFCPTEGKKIEHLSGRQWSPLLGSTW